MLSLAPVRSSGGAATYFAKDDYHTAEGAAEASAWGGTGAVALGLTGEVEKSSFERLLDGQLPSGELVGQVQNRQAGIDISFSMPKSASVLTYVGGDERIMKAHMAAVRGAMGWAERSFAEGRSYERTKSGEPVRTGNLVYALFQHDTSRSLDPQGHIHAVVANMTRLPDGKWAALHNGRLWRNSAAIGADYHARFRLELAKLGYETVVTGKHGQFEVQGVPEQVVAAFSQRRADILTKAGELGVTSPQGLRAVTERTRDAKVRVDDRDGLRESWAARAAALGFDAKAVADAARDRIGALPSDERRGTVAELGRVLDSLRDALGGRFRAGDPLVDRGLARLRLSPADARAQGAVASAVRILGQREAAFGVDDLAKTALGLGLAGVTGERVDARIAQLIRDERLVPGLSARIDAQVTDVTTPEAIATEARILAGIDAGKGRAQPIVAPAEVIDRLSAAAGDRPLNAGQLAAATLALAFTDRIVAVQGVAGAGKSTMIASLARVAEGEGKRVVGLAFQNKMVGDLAQGAGIEARTVSSFVNAYARHALAGQGGGYEAARESLRNTVLLLDEASMVASEPMLHLIGIANSLGVDRLVLVGDRQQLSSIDAGKAFALAQAGGVALERMDENLRQRTDQLRAVAALANRGQAKAALGVLGTQVSESQDHVGAAARRWLELAPAERETTGVFASGRETRAELNRLIQEGLAAEGSLKGETLALTVLERVNLTREELRYASNYRAGMRLEVARPMESLELGRGSYAVRGVDERGRVELEVGGRVRRFDPQDIDPSDKRDALGLVVREDVRLHAGDRIRWTMNDKERGLLNAALARVVSVAESGITVETADRSLVELKRDDPMLERLGLAYALNMHMAQGVTVDHGIAVMTSSERHLSNQRLFNVTVTRVRDSLELFTDDKAKLGQALDRNPGDKTSALETVGQIRIDARAGQQGERPFAPELPPDLARAAEKDAHGLRVGAGAKPVEPPVPEKGMGLEL